jgi:predicted deacylase
MAEGPGLWRTDAIHSIVMYDHLSFQEFHDRVNIAASRHAGSVQWLDNGGAQVRIGDQHLPAICIVSGLHGDERSGPIAILRLLERANLLLPVGYSLLVFPLVNDVGWNARTREWSTLDLNRSFGLPHAPKFLQQIADEIARSRPPGFLDLHEDSDTDFPYIFRYLRDDPEFALELQAELSARDEWWDDNPGWAGASECHARAHGSRVAATLEAPPVWALERRVEWNMKAVEVGIACMPRHLARVAR